MNKFKTLTSWAAVLREANIDTDRIIPAKHLKTVKRKGLGRFVFEAARFDENGEPRPDFVLNRPPFDKAKILITGPNFGCGSSREHAVWALTDFGIRAIISENFADIFASNAQKNGLLLVKLPKNNVEKVSRAAKGHKITIDLPSQVITAEGGNFSVPFTINPFEKTCLLEGFDSIALTLNHEDKIKAFEDRWRKETPWLYND